MDRKIEQQKLSLPQGGGAVTGLGESFQPNAFSGTAQLSIPIYLTPGRSLSPSLALDYSSGGGNGPFGLGCSLPLPMVARQTRLHVPRYDDTDVFSLSGEGDLTPRADVPVRREDDGGAEWEVRTYRPRTEGGMSLIERWRRADTGESHWRVVSAENVTTVYGRTAQARIADPAAPSRIFQWLVEESWDARGNRVLYGYVPEDTVGVAPAVFEADRGPNAQRYPAWIRYGNYFPDGAPGDEAFAFEVVFDYGQYDLDDLSAGSRPDLPARPWPARKDPFSSYRSGFEIRTCRLCRAVLMFHHFPDELGPEPCLVRATRFGYDETETFSFLTAACQEGFLRAEDGSYTRQTLPPLTLSYSRFDPPPAPEFRPLTVPVGSAMPGYLQPGAYQPVDLDGEGLPGFLYADGASTLYYAPLGEGEYAPPRTPPSFPDARELGSGAASLQDLDGDGRLELVVQTGGLAGFYPREDDGGWGGYRPLRSVPTAGGEPADLDGDGRSDLLAFEGGSLVYYPSAGTEGYGAPRRRTRPAGFPRGAGSEGEVVVFADVFGDGMQHRVLIRDGQVRAWPSLGYGRFGNAVELGNAPRLRGGTAAPRVHLADVDGSGTADLVLAWPDRVEVYRNQSGNSFAPPIQLALPGTYSDPAQITFADVLGTGATSLVFTQADPAVRHWFVDFGGAVPPTVDDPAPPATLKPYLLVRMENQLGAATDVRYASSTRFYLEDRRAGRPWATRLPFPVQVVEEIVTTDRVSGARMSTRRRYHDGCWDPVERSFNGFGYVESWDTERFEAFNRGTARLGAPALDPGLYVPPVYTRTWYHTGTLRSAEVVRAQYRAEYWSGDPQAYVMPDSWFDPLIDGAGPATVRQAYAALKGQELHREVYGLDGSPREGVPYTVRDQNWQVRMLQPAVPGAAASFFVHARETLTYDYEREATDPRAQHDFFLATTLFADDGAEEYHELGCTVHYGRRPSGDPAVHVYPEQAELKATAGLNRFTRVTTPFRMVGVPFEERTFELAGLSLDGATYFGFDQVKAQVEAALADPVVYGAPFTGPAPQARPLSWEQSWFWDQAQQAALPLGKISARGLLHHTPHCVFSDLWVAETYGGRVDEALLREQGGYGRVDDGYWWNRGLVQYYATDPAGFYLPVMTRNDFALDAELAGVPVAPGLVLETRVRHDAPYALAVVEVAQVLDESTSLAETAVIDYTIVSPRETVDPNGVVRQVLADPLGRVIATTVFKPASGGAPRQGDGDLAAYVVRPAATLDEVLGDKAFYLQDATAFYWYDPWAPSAAPAEGPPRPAATIDLSRQVHVSDVPPGGSSPIQALVAFTDGLGRVVEQKQQAEPGEAVLRAADGALLRTAQGAPRVEVVEERWIVTGRTVFNNKGEPAEEYLPYYTSTPHYETQAEITEAGLVPPPSVIHYDPLLRRVRVHTPKGFFSRIAFTSWTETRYDENDTVKESPYYRAHIDDPELPPAEREALVKAAVAYNTPSVTVLDNTGVAIRQVESNLGDVTPDTLEPVVAGSGITAQALWAELVGKGYLETSTTPPAGTWITGLFQPYVPGFRMELAPEFQPLAPAATELLRQGVLTTFLAADAAGRTTDSIDPRLFWSNLSQGTDFFSFRWTYGMDGDAAARTRGADAGDRWALANVFGSDLAAWDARPVRVDRTYDRLQRLRDTLVTDAEGTVRLTEEVAYGEGQPDAALHNLRGQVWRYRDQAGVELNPDYTFQGQVALTTRQLRADYRGEVDWAGTVTLDPAVYPTSFRYDALMRLTAETTPDGSTTIPGYHLSGRLRSLRVTDADGTDHPYVDDVVYTAASERTRLDYHNGVVQRSTYEWTTGRLTGLSTTRPAAPERDPVLQDVAYTYDPVGNVTLRVDRTAETVFCYNQQVEARGDYTYDPLYRLLSATGRQHPGIAADTHLTGFKQSLWAYLCPPDPNDQVKLERYEERYTSDDSGNLVTLRHTAASASFTRQQPVEPGSNRLRGVGYDACGNPLSLSLLNTVGLAWDYRGQLSSTTRIERPGGRNDQDWYVYDHGGRRLRKVVERVEQGGSVTEVDDHVYLGTFELRRITRQGGGDPVTVVERQTLRVMDDATCVAIRDRWLQDPLQRQASTGEVRERYQLEDLLGSVAVEVDGSAALLSYEEYYPFGGTALIAGEDRAEVEAKVYRWAGKECDDSTGLYYYGLRYYAPWLGRWLNPDPTGPSGGPNLYAFAGGNPTSRFDSNGGTPFDVTDLTDDEVFDAIKDLRSTIRTGASTTFSFGGTHSTAKRTYTFGSVTSFGDWSSIIATGEKGGFKDLAIRGTGSTGQVLTTFNSTNFEIKAGAWGRYTTYENKATVSFFKETRRKLLGKDPIATTSKRTAGDYFSVIAGLAEAQRDTLGGIASFMAVSNAYWTGTDKQAKSLYRSYYTASPPLLSFAPGGGQKFLTDFRDHDTIDPTFKSNLVSVARTFLNNVKVAKGGARLSDQSYTTRGDLLKGVRDALYRKFRVAPLPPPPVLTGPIVFGPLPTLTPPTTTTTSGGGGSVMRRSSRLAKKPRVSYRYSPY